MKKHLNLKYIVLLILCLSIVSCNKISQFLPKDYSGNYISYDGTTIVMQKSTKNKIWITLGISSAEGWISDNKVFYPMNSTNTAIFIINPDDVTLSSEVNGKVIPNTGRKINDPGLWSAFQSYNKSDFNSAFPGFQKYLEIHPDDMLTEIFLTNCLLQQGKLEDAKTELAKIEKNPEAQSNSVFNRDVSLAKYLLAGKEKSAAGLNAWDGYESVLSQFTSTPQIPQKVLSDLRAIEMSQKPIGPAERESLQQYLSPNLLAILKFLDLPEKPECYITYATQSSGNNIRQAQVMARAVVLYARILSESGKLKESADADRRVIRMGQQMMQGPLNNQLMGIAVRATGEAGMGHLVTDGKIYQANDAQMVYAILKDLRKTDPISTQESLFQMELNGGIVTEFKSKMLSRAYNVQTKLILLETAAAVKLYQLEEGSTPESLQPLIPKYLSEVPVDTFAKNPVIYKSSPNLMLYSYGPDSTDDGGQILYDPTNGAFSRGDMVFP